MRLVLGATRPRRDSSSSRLVLGTTRPRRDSSSARLVVGATRPRRARRGKERRGLIVARAPIRVADE
eukprot:4805715-Lingulodinium_polyedra.AAC.1